MSFPIQSQAEDRSEPPNAGSHLNSRHRSDSVDRDVWDTRRSNRSVTSVTSRQKSMIRMRGRRRSKYDIGETSDISMRANSALTRGRRVSKYDIRKRHKVPTA